MRNRRQTRQGIISLLLGIMLTAALLADSAAIESLRSYNGQWTGDFDGMVKRHEIRALVPYSKTFYFLDGVDQRGLIYENLMGFEKYLNRGQRKKALKVRLIIIPTARDRLLPDLMAGRGDIAAGNLTITPARQEQVDFADPFFSDINEILITGPSAPPIRTIDDLAGEKIHTRVSSSYHDSLKHLNYRFKKRGLKPVTIIPASEYLEDEDLLEMVNAGLIPMVVVDSHKGQFWTQIFKNLTLHPTITLRTNGQIAWCVRKNSPGLRKKINGYAKRAKKGTLLGNILFKRYLKDTKWVRNPRQTEELKRFNRTIAFFQKYADRYQFDWLAIAALSYQESRIDQSKRSSDGAVGVMQVLPSTAADPNVNIHEIEKLENNIHAGVKYLRFIHDRYYSKRPMDALNKMLFSFASYNAGPAKINKLRKEADRSGLDPNIWFRHVEVIAAKRIGRETVQYVSNIYKYYIAYRLIEEDKGHKQKEKKKTRL